MSSARINLPPELNGLLLDELELCIAQANLGVEDTWLIRRYLIARVPQADLAAEMDWNRSTISAHITRAMAKVAEAAGRLHTNRI